MTTRFLESVQEEAFEGLLCLKEKHVHTVRMWCPRSIENFQIEHVIKHYTCCRS